jgi:hypothetical protein
MLPVPLQLAWHADGPSAPPPALTFEASSSISSSSCDRGAVWVLSRTSQAPALMALSSSPLSSVKPSGSQ